MPNWCFQNLVVKGDKNEVSRFLSAVTQPNPDEYDLNKLVPLDPRSESTRTHTRDDGTVTTFSVFSTLEDDGFDGYNHALQAWGSKWGACSVRVREVADERLHMAFDSAWGPADKLIMRISSQFPSLTFGISFTEEADFFAGWLVFKDGELIAEGDVSTEVPKNISDLYETNEDEYYDRLNEYQTEMTENLFSLMETDMDEETKEEVNQ